MGIGIERVIANFTYTYIGIKQFRDHRAWMEQNVPLQSITEFPNDFLDVLSALCQDR